MIDISHKAIKMSKNVDGARVCGVFWEKATKAFPEKDNIME
jgi:hypothetical protein